LTRARASRPNATDAETTSSAGLEAAVVADSTVPAPSMPATMGQLRTTGLLFVMARPSL
jgi:hypothetical protein